MKNLKKATAVMTVLTLSAAMGITVYAEAGSNTVGSITGTLSHEESIGVKGTYQTGSEVTKIYKVDIEWGKMEFIYTAGAKGAWDPDSHTYGGETTGSWTPAEKEADGDLESNQITITNHSNAEVKATFAFAGTGTIDGDFYPSNESDAGVLTSLTLPTADNNEGGSGIGVAKSESVYFKIAEDSVLTESTDIGNITVSITNITE